LAPARTGAKLRARVAGRPASPAEDETVSSFAHQLRRHRFGDRGSDRDLREDLVLFRDLADVRGELGGVREIGECEGPLDRLHARLQDHGPLVESELEYRQANAFGLHAISPPF
jgi:hypothetical protein